MNVLVLIVLLKIVQIEGDVVFLPKEHDRYLLRQSGFLRNDSFFVSTSTGRKYFIPAGRVTDFKPYKKKYRKKYGIYSTASFPFHYGEPRKGEDYLSDW